MKELPNSILEVTLSNYQELLESKTVSWSNLAKTNPWWDLHIAPDSREPCLFSMLQEMLRAKSVGEPLRVLFDTVTQTLYMDVATGDKGLKPMPLCEALVQDLDSIGTLPMDYVVADPEGSLFAVVDTDKPWDQLVKERRRVLSKFKAVHEDPDLSIVHLSADKGNIFRLLCRMIDPNLLATNYKNHYPDSEFTALSIESYFAPMTQIQDIDFELHLLQLTYAGNLFGTALYLVKPTEVFWVNTICDRSCPQSKEKQLGNYLIGRGLQLAHSLGLPYNLGMATPAWDYKHLWKPRLAVYPGYSYQCKSNL